MGTVGKRITAPTFTWRLVPPKKTEDCRWESADGRWVALLAREAETLRVTVIDSSGRRQSVDSYEGALALARSWRI
jgi:hypothetical protein